MDFLKSTWQKLKDTVAKMGKTAKIIAASGIGAAIIVSVIMTIVLNQTNYVSLYPEGELSAGEAGTIFTLLQEQGVDVRTEGTGTLLVPEDEAETLRISLAAQGYPEEGLNYDLAFPDSGFGATDAESQLRKQLQLQENLRVIINKMDKIKDSFVTVNLATQSSYVSSSNRTDSSAAVMLIVEDGEEISNAEARSVAEFMLRAVPMLKIENLNITDSAMRAYDISEDPVEVDPMEMSLHQRTLVADMKDVLEDQVLRVLEPVMGYGNVAVSVNLAMDFDDTTISSVEFSPPVEGMEEGLVRSREVLRDTLWRVDEEGGIVGTESNGIGGTEYLYDNEDLGLVSESLSEIYNYELNEVKTLIEKAQGTITGLSVAVVINSEIKSADQVLDAVEDLVANAVGVDREYISAAALPFIEKADQSLEGLLSHNQEMLEKLNRNDLIKTLCICGVILIIVAMVLIFLKKILFPKKPEQSEELPAPVGEHIDITIGEESELSDIERRQKLIDGLKKKSESVQKVEDLMNADMDAVVQIIRNWLAE